MGSPFLNQMKKHASSFIHERYKDARLLLTDITEAEILAEKVTNNEPCSPNARTMTRIAEASYDIEDYWRIVDVLHRRLNRVDWKHWRQSYKSLVLLDFLLTHGPEEFAVEFDESFDVIEELGSFRHTDEKGIDWGLNMQKISDRVLELLKGGDKLIQERLKAIKTTKEIQGFGNLSIPTSTSSSTSPSPSSSGSSSINLILDSATSLSSPNSNLTSWSESDVQNDDEISPWAEEETERNLCPRSENRDIPLNRNRDENVNRTWNSSSVQEIGSLIEAGNDEDIRKGKGKFSSSFMSGLSSKLGISPRGNGKKFGNIMSVPHDGDVKNKKINRQFSVG